MKNYEVELIEKNANDLLTKPFPKDQERDLEVLMIETYITK